MHQWYWKKNGIKHGTVTTLQLKGMAERGKLKPNDLIWCKGLPKWTLASEANGLDFGSPDTVADLKEHDEIDFSEIAELSKAHAKRKDIALPIKRNGTSLYHGIIKHRCVHCATGLESESSLAGKQDTCPICNNLTPVPLTSTMGAGAFFRKIPKAAYIGCAAVVLVAVVSLTAWLAFRDTWERDHGPELRQMGERTISLIRAGKDEEGVAKYEAMLALVGNRQLEDPQLRQAVADAKAKAEPVKRQLEEQRREVERQRRMAAEAAARKRYHGHWMTETDALAVHMYIGPEAYQNVLMNMGEEDGRYVYRYEIISARGDWMRVKHRDGPAVSLWRLSADGKTLSTRIEVDKTGERVPKEFYDENPGLLGIYTRVDDSLVPPGRPTSSSPPSRQAANYMSTEERAVAAKLLVRLLRNYPEKQNTLRAEDKGTLLMFIVDCAERNELARADALLLMKYASGPPSVREVIWRLAKGELGED